LVEGMVVKEKFIDADNLQPTGVDKSDSIVNYFVGNQKNWRSNIPTYDTITLGEVWPSVEVELKAYGNNLEKIFKVVPGGDVNSISIGFDGITGLTTTEDGNLLLETKLGPVSMSKPVAYQYINDSKKYVDVSYSLLDTNSYGFMVGKYDSDYSLIIDPLLASTFLGGLDDEVGTSISLDSVGNVFVTVDVDSATDEACPDLAVCIHIPKYDVSVFKLSNDLSTLFSSTFLGGSGDSQATSISLDSSDNVFVTALSVCVPLSVVCVSLWCVSV